MTRLIGAFVAAVFLVGPAAAQGIAEKARQAETLAGQGKYVEAIAALDEAATLLWDKAPLTFRRALWVAEPPSGFGAYSARETNVYAPGADMIVYAEPVGFGWRKSGDIWRTDLITDLVLKSKDGKVLYQKIELQRLQIGSRVRNREFMARFTYTFTGIAAGEYLAQTTLRDAVTGKKGTFTLPFVVQ